MNIRYIKVLLLFLVCFISPPSNALVIVPDNNINAENDIVVINKEIDQPLADAVTEKIHSLQDVDKNKPIYILLDSPGGEVIEGARIIDAMTASKRHIYTVAMGETASMAAIIHSYGEKRYMLPNAILMYHTISGSYSGDIVRVQSRLNMAKALQDKYVQHICSVSNVPVEELNNRIMTEWWVNSNEALNRKLIDDTIASTAFFIPKEKAPPQSAASPFPWLPLLPQK